jgi:integrase
MRLLLANADREFIPIVGLGAFAGLRQSEIERLDWSAVDLPRSRIRLEAAATKTSQRRLVDIPANLAAWLAPIAKASGPVVESAKRARLLRLEAMKAASLIEWPENGLRHSYASYHLALFCNAAKTAEQLGHSTSKTTYAHYREVCTPEDAREWFAMNPPADYANVIAFKKEAAHG